MSNGSWLGGDVAASFPVNDDVRIWIFGDTLVGTFSKDCPKPLVFCHRSLAKGSASGPVRNSIGVLHGSPGAYQPIERFWGQKDNGEPTSFFSTAKPNRYLWPLSGVPIEQGLIILANENSETSGLAPVGGVLIHVQNPLDPPEQWKIRQREIPFRGGTAENPTRLSITSGIVRQGDFLVAVGSVREKDGTSGAILARIPITALENFDAPWNWEWWMKTPEGAAGWEAPLNVERLSLLEGLPGTSEATFDRNPQGIWETYQIPAFSYSIHRFTADSLSGPWQDQGPVYRAPIPWSRPAHPNCNRIELRSARSRKNLAVRRSIARDPLCRTGQFIVYAPKSHPGLGGNGSRTLTYNVNLFFGSLKALASAVRVYPGFYVPRVVIKPRVAK